MALQNYEGAAEFYVESRLLAEASSTELTVSGRNNEVATMQRNVAGKSRGAIRSEMRVDSAIPKAGFERDWITHLRNGDYVRVILDSGGRRIEVTMWCDEVSIRNSVDATATISATLIGGEPEIR